jgi:ATP-binding cassette subfamily B protein
MAMHGGGGWFGYLRATDEKPKVTWDLLKRVLTYSRPYRWQLTGMLVLILITTGTALLMPLIFRRMIDYTIPAGDVPQLALLALALLIIPAFNGVINVFQRQLNARVGEGVVYDLRVALFAHLQRMSLHFVTNTKVGEMMSRLNNDAARTTTHPIKVVTRFIAFSSPRCGENHVQLEGQRQ